MKTNWWNMSFILSRQMCIIKNNIEKQTGVENYGKIDATISYPIWLLSWRKNITLVRQRMVYDMYKNR